MYAMNTSRTGIMLVGTTRSRLSCLVGAAAIVLVMGTAGVAEAQKLHVAPGPEFDATPGKPFALVVRVEPASGAKGATVRLRVTRSPVQNFVMSPKRFTLDLGGSAEGRVSIKAQNMADIYGGWEMEAVAVLKNKTLTKKFKVNFPLKLKQKKYGDEVGASIGQVTKLKGLKVVNEAGKGAANIAIKWEATGAAKSKGEVRTNAKGFARIPFTAKKAGNYTVVASLVRTGKQFTGNAKYYVKTSMSLASQGPKVIYGVPGKALDKPLVMKVSDASGKAVSGVGVEWKVTKMPVGASSTVKLKPPSNKTKKGIAEARLTLGKKVGKYRVEANLTRVSGPRLTSEVARFEIQTYPGKKLETMQCGKSRKTIVDLVPKYRKISGDFKKKVTALKDYQSEKQADLRKLSKVIDNMRATAYELHFLGQELNSTASRRASDMAWSSYLFKFGSLLSKAYHAARAGVKLRQGEAMKKVLKHLGLELVGFEVLEHIAKHYGPDKAKKNWKTVVEARDSIQLYATKAIKGVEELKRVYNKRLKEFRAEGKKRADAANKVAKKGNPLVKRIWDAESVYRRCRTELIEAGVKPTDIEANWGGKSKYDKFMKQGVPKLDDVKTAGWQGLKRG